MLLLLSMLGCAPSALIGTTECSHAAASSHFVGDASGFYINSIADWGETEVTLPQYPQRLHIHGTNSELQLSTMNVHVDTDDNSPHLLEDTRILHVSGIYAAHSGSTQPFRVIWVEVVPDGTDFTEPCGSTGYIKASGYAFRDAPNCW